MKNYLADMLYALTSAYSRKDYNNTKQENPLKTNIGKLFSIFAWGLGIVHDEAENVKQWDFIENAKGSVLDRYGANFGVSRNGMSDLFYRLAIRVKVLSQLSGGDIDTIINAAAELFDIAPEDVRLDEKFPAKIWLSVDITKLSEERREFADEIAAAIKRLLAAGIGMRTYIEIHRVFRADLSIAHLTYISVGLDTEPISQDRLSRQEVRAQYAGYVNADFSPPMIGKDRIAVSASKLTHSAFYRPNVVSNTPGQNRVSVGRQDSSGGVYYSTHIKAKRIE